MRNISFGIRCLKMKTTECSLRCFYYEDKRMKFTSFPLFSSCSFKEPTSASSFNFSSRIPVVCPSTFTQKSVHSLDRMILSETSKSLFCCLPFRGQSIKINPVPLKMRLKTTNLIKQSGLVTHRPHSLSKPLIFLFQLLNLKTEEM